MASGCEVDCVTVFGGSGFLGSRIVKQLARAGVETRVACRHPDNVISQFQSDQHANISPVYADVRDEASVALAMAGSDGVINAVGLYVQTGSERFEAVHELGAVNVAHQASVLEVNRLVHISGIGADLYSQSDYIRARAKGELLVQDVFPAATVLRPSVLFGSQDAFLNTLSRIARSSPVLPLFGRGSTMLQPVYVGDVAKAAVNALSAAGAPGNVYELGGPQIYSYKALIALVLTQAKQRRFLLPTPFPIWDLAAQVLSILPRPPLTKAQVTLMKQDNIVSGSALTLKDLGVDATSLEDILPRYAFSRA
ncbi:MAG: complex I NDUFA9 subunit family protein [Rhizobiales bacterium]|nr:complex I NDUFA9 subunit family protein [Hyphomicrobiales bacterium]